ncbi:MAG: nickel/cobalt transporter [Kiloniellales bacterium]|nr:nickel/cobalt transporter [Kiloniellales bacterium]
MQVGKPIRPKSGLQEQVLLRPLRRGFCLLFALLIAFSIAEAGLAQSIDPSPAKEAVAEPGLWQQALDFVRAKQREIQSDLAGAVRVLRTEKSFAAAWSLIALSFFYGIFHALGPGHGKAVVSTYLLTERSDLKKGLALSWAGSLMQGFTAIVLVFGVMKLVDWTHREAQDAVGTLETVSFGLIALVGVGLLVRSLWGLRKAIAGYRSDAAAFGGDQASHDCGHKHGPSAEELIRASGWRASLSIIFSIGIRPCSGGVLVLLIAAILKLPWAGVGAVIAMSIGTAITVSLLATLAVYMQKASIGLAKVDARRAAIFAQLAAMAGGIFIAAFGSLLFFGSLGPSHPLL